MGGDHPNDLAEGPRLTARTRTLFRPPGVGENVVFDREPDGSDGEGEFDVFERTEHEPEEYDPEAEFRDPDSDSITIPEVSTDESDVPPDLLRTFWTLVIVLNVAILAVAVGLMLIGFEGQLRNGGVLIGGGLVLFGLSYRRYRTFRAEDDAERDSGDESGSAPTGSNRAETERGDETGHEA